MAYPRLSVRQRTELDRITPSADAYCDYAPCRVTLRSGEVLDCVYLIEAEKYLRAWGDDPTRPMVSVEDIRAIEESPSRLPVELANKLYAAGESGMGYHVFTVIMRDGSQLPYLTGNAVDFPRWPDAVNASDAIDVLPHTGRDALADPGPFEQAADYHWCLYST